MRGAGRVKWQCRHGRAPTTGRAAVREQWDEGCWGFVTPPKPTDGRLMVEQHSNKTLLRNKGWQNEKSSTETRRVIRGRGRGWGEATVR